MVSTIGDLTARAKRVNRPRPKTPKPHRFCCYCARRLGRGMGRQVEDGFACRRNCEQSMHVPVFVEPRPMSKW